MKINNTPTVELAVGVFHDERRSFLMVCSDGVNVEKKQFFVALTTMLLSAVLTAQYITTPTLVLLLSTLFSVY